MATLNVPGAYASIADAVAVARRGDTIVIAPGYAGSKSANVSVEGLVFDAPSSVTGIVLYAESTIRQITLRGASPIELVGHFRGDSFFGNAGANKLFGSVGSDTIDGGAGNDTITVEYDGTDRLYGGKGNDTFLLQTFGSTGRGTIDGGTGLDTIRTGDLGGFGLRNVEILDVADSRDVVATAAQLDSFRSIVDSGAQRTQIAINLTGAGRAIDFTKRIASGDSVVIFDGGLTSGLKVKGSAGGDRFFATKYNDLIDGGGGNDTFHVYGRTIFTPGGTDTLRGGAGNDTFDLFDSGRGIVNGGTGTDTVESSNLDGFKLSGVEVLDTSDVTATISQLTAFDTIVASDFSGALQIGVNLRGKGGTIDFSHAIVGADSLRVNGNELASGLKAIGTKNADVFYASRYSDVLDGGAGADTIYGSSKERGSDVLRGGSGNDIFELRNGGDGVVDGGTGTDTVRIFELDGLTFRNVEVLDTKEIHGTVAQISVFDRIGDSIATSTPIMVFVEGAGGSIDFTNRITGSDRIYLQGEDAKAGIKATGSTNEDVLVGSNHSDTFKGGKGDDSLQGQKGNDTLDGGAGNDLFFGGAGSDTMTGGSGADTFVFQEVGAANSVDRVTDFVASTASVHDRLYLTGVDVAETSSGDVAPSAFKDLGVAGAMLDANDRIIYDHRTGVLSFDSDGSGARAAVQIAVLENHVLLTSRDFVV